MKLEEKVLEVIYNFRWNCFGLFLVYTMNNIYVMLTMFQELFLEFPTD